MGFFSRRSKPPKADSSRASASVVSFGSTASRMISNNRASAASILTPVTTVTTVSSMPQVKLPKIDLPRPPDPQLDPAGYLRSLGAVRERSKIIYDKAMKNKLNHFDVDMSKMDDVCRFVSGLIKRDYEAPYTTIPGHGRYQHFSVGGKDRVASLLASWPESVDNTERCRRLIDLFLVSVLLDAGAGTQWSFKSKDNGRTYRRSEGLAVASLEMFNDGAFSGNPDNKYQVDRIGLQNLTVAKIAHGMQVHEGNKLAGLEGRTQLLIRLGHALEEKIGYFGTDGRPGNMIDHLLSHPSTQAQSILIVPLPVLWNVLMSGLATIWPASRIALNGVSLGDAWPCQAMPQSGTSSWESIIPFHKLTQWLTYSLMQPMQTLLNIHFAGIELLTGLPEYRNGGLFVDLGVLTLKHDDTERGLDNYSDWCRRTGTKAVEVAPMFEPADDVIVEWRAVTIGLLDDLCKKVNETLKPELAGEEMSLAQVLEAGSWKAGREIAEINRPNTKEPPILIESDGTVF